MEGFEGSPLRPKPDLVMRKRAADHLRERFELGPLGSKFWVGYTKVALYAGDVEFARRVLSEWGRKSPNDAGYLYYRALAELQAGAYGQ
jgi:hypothetical protein